MRELRHQLFLAGTALALILGSCPGAIAQQSVGKMAAAPAAAETPAMPNVVLAPPAAETTPAAATEQTMAPDPMAALDPADRAIAEKLRDLFASQADRIFTSKKERAAVEAFYRARVFVPVWLDKGMENPRARAAVSRLKNADADGLEVSDYKVPNFSGAAAEALAEADLKLTHAVLTYARHLQAGRFAYTRVSRNIELPQAAPESADILAAVTSAADAGAALDAFRPQHEAYRKLKAALAELRASGAAKNAHQIEVVIANMERWRWYARELGDAHVVVNQPDFTLRVMHRGNEVWTTRIVIGKPSMATPLLSETMKHITVNPTWHVPPSIVHNEYLPALAQDPTVLSRMGLHVSYSGGQVSISQPPGPGNALGRIRFNFPNRFLVYQHDTPDKHMFGHEVRAYSHGCMRVQDPAKYAEVLLNIARPQEHWSAERIKGMFGHGEQDIQLQPVPIWVHLTYQTAFVDSAGKLQMRRDVYGLDSRTLAAIKSERGTLDGVPERKPDLVASAPRPRRPAAAPASAYGYQPSTYQSVFAPAPGYFRGFPQRTIYR